MRQRSKMVEPAFVMHWAHTVSKVALPEDSGAVTVWAGELDGIKGQPAPPNSWAADEVPYAARRHRLTRLFW